jgi:hypothetical protein
LNFSEKSAFTDSISSSVLVSESAANGLVVSKSAATGSDCVLADRFDSANGASGAVDTHEATSAGVVDVSVVAVVAVGVVAVGVVAVVAGVVAVDGAVVAIAVVGGSETSTTTGEGEREEAVETRSVHSEVQ